MTTLKVIVLFGFLLRDTLFTTASSMSYFEREWNLTLHDLTSEDKIGKDNIATYAKCNDISKTKRECILIYEFLHPEGFIFKNKCYVGFTHDKDIEELSSMKIRAATKGKVVISYVSDHEGKKPNLATVYRIIDTSTCKYYESKVLFNVSQLNYQLGDKFWKGNVFLNDDDTFDTFLAQKDLCNDSARCRVTFRSDGKMIRDPVSYLPSEMLAKDIKMYPLIKTSEHSEFFTVVEEMTTKNSSHPDGLTDLKLLHASADSTSPETVLDLSDVSTFDVDNSQETLGICWSYSIGKNITGIDCHQYDIKKVKTLSVSFELPYLVKILNVKNTWRGEELLLLTDECENDLCESDGRYYIRAINRRKSHSGNMEISGLNCPGNQKETSISVFNYNSIHINICVSTVCQNFVRNSPGKSYNNVKLVRQCFLTKYVSQAF